MCCSLSFMECPFIDEVVEEGALIELRVLQGACCFGDSSDPVAYPDNYLYEHYRFS